MKSIKENWLVILIASLLGLTGGEVADVAQLTARGDKAVNPKVVTTDDGHETNGDPVAVLWRVHYTVSQSGTPDTYQTFDDVEYVGAIPKDTIPELVDIPEGYEFESLVLSERWPPIKKK